MKKTRAFMKENPLNQLYYLANIPRRFCKDVPLPSPIDIVYGSDQNNPLIISRNEQIAWINRLLSDPKELRKNYFIGIGSEPTDESGLKLACAIAKSALKQTYMNYVKFNVDFINAETLKDYKKNNFDIDILVIHNVIECITNNRLQDIRDALSLFEYAFRIVVVSGTNPLYFLLRFLKMKPNGVFYFRDVRSI